MNHSTVSKCTKSYRLSRYYLSFNRLMINFKRVLDLSLASFLIILLLPVLLLIACIIAIESEGSPIYRQWRKGYGGKPFQIYKFRTMRNNSHPIRTIMIKQDSNDEIIFKFKDDKRITRIGRYLRDYSLDELPQLINVIKGEMSLIGARPFSLEVFDRIPAIYPEFQRWMNDRHQMLPGMTGLWQVSGRNDLPTDELIRLDLEYVNNWTFGRDLGIFLLTIPVVLKKKGAY